MDGVALKEAANAWVSGPPAVQLALLAVVEGIRGIEWGPRVYADYTTGLTFFVFVPCV